MVPAREREYSPLGMIILTSAPKDPEMEKFYNDLKAAETLHSAAATIIAGTQLHHFRTDV